MRKEGKRGAILVENMVFIILNLIYLTILVVFLVQYSGGASLLEEAYAKEIALILDSAKPGMTVVLKMEDAFDFVKKNFGEDNYKDIVRIDGNLVTVKLNFDEKHKGYSYSFFNNIDAGTYGNGYYSVNNEKQYVFVLGGYK